VDWSLVIAFGLCVGILVGTTGIGGGSLMTPLLILVLGTAPTTAVGFVLGLTSAGSGALIAVGLFLVFRLTPLRVVGVWIGSNLAFRLPENALRPTLAIVRLRTHAARAGALLAPEHA
jgi:uncharacterized membrane protein YfcA